MRSFALAAILAISVAGLATGARAQSLPAAAASIIPSLEKATGMPIVILERTGDDPGDFWYRAMKSLCAKTGDNWCEGDVQVLTDTTNILGWSRVLTFRPEGGATDKKVCVVLPPAPGVSAGYVATGLAGGGVFGWRELPTQPQAEAYLYLLHAAGCMATGSNEATELKRSDAFAALALTLLEGNQAFVNASGTTPSRTFATFRSQEAIRWSVSVGERVLLDLWKGQAAAALRSGSGCAADVVASTRIDTQSIQRAPALPAGQDCTTRSAGTASGQVSDENLWLWTSAGSFGAYWPTVSLPAYSPFAGFASVDEGVAYAWTTAGSIASQR